MKNRLLTMASLLLLVVVFQAPLFGQKHYKDLTYPKLREINVPEPKQITLENGMKVLLLEDHEFPFINMEARFIAGAAWEPADKVGLAGITGTVMRTGGSTSISGDQMDEELESIAASVETYIATLYGTASLFTLKDHIDKVFGIFADVLMHPAFPEDKIDLAKIEARSVTSRRNDDVGEIAYREFHQLIYGEHSPYYRDAEYATIDAITRDDLVDFHKKYVRPNGMVLGVWGDFKTKDMTKKIQSAFEGWQPVGSTEIAPPEVKYDFKYTVNLVEKTDVNQTNIYLGHIADRKDNPDRAAQIMMNEVLSGGFSSRTFSRLRSDQGLAYSVGGVYGTNYVYPGAFYMFLQTKSERTVEAIRSMLKELRLMTEELVTDEELRVAKEGYVNSFVFNFDSIDEIMGRLVTYTYYGYPLDFLQKTKEGIEKVTKEDILRVAKKYLKPDQVQILAVGKSEDFDEPLSVLGEVNEIDITIPAPKEATPEATTESLVRGRELIEKAVEAHGGLENLQKIKNFKIKFDLTQVTPMGEMTMNVEAINVYPDKSYALISTPMGEVTMVLVGEQGWMSTPQGTFPIPEAQKNSQIKGRDRDTMRLLKEYVEYTFQYIGEREFGDKDAIDVLAMRGDNSFHVLLDPETFLVAGYIFSDVTDKGPAEMEEYDLDNREQYGLIGAWKSITYANGEKANEVTLTEVEMNVEVDPKLFEKE